jgi:Ca2+-dependent lipid-binding protein
MKYVPLTWSVEFIALEGKNLRAADASGTSDPYVIFSGAPCVCEAVGEPVPKTLNPVWPRQKLPTIHVCAESPQSLEQDHILISIMDRDTVTSDDLLGCSVLSFRSLRFSSGVDPFRGAWPQQGQAQASFELPVLYAGIRQGSISGTVSISPTASISLDEFYRGKTLGGKAVAGLSSVLLRALTVSS